MEVEEGEFIIRKKEMEAEFRRNYTGVENARKIIVEFDEDYYNSNDLAGVFRMPSFTPYNEGGCVIPCKEIGNNISVFVDLNTRLNLLMISFDHRVLMCAKWFVNLFRIK